MPGKFIDVDLSRSMSFLLMSGLSRYEAMKAMLPGLLVRFPGAALHWFNDDFGRVNDPGGLPPPSGSTDVAGSLKNLRQYNPDTVVLVCDGEPDDVRAALTAALLLNCRIVTVYVGDESNVAAIKVMDDIQKCSRKGTAGASAVVSLEDPKKAAEEILQLAAPKS